jgi:hypothetical protein
VRFKSEHDLGLEEADSSSDRRSSLRSREISRRYPSADREIEAATEEEAQGTSPRAEDAVKTVAGSRREPIPALGECGLHSVPKPAQSAERQGSAEVGQIVLGTDKFSESETAWQVAKWTRKVRCVAEFARIQCVALNLNSCEFSYCLHSSGVST